VSGLPPVSGEAIQREGEIVSRYDPLTDHTKTEFLARVDARQMSGLHLYAYFVYPGQRAVQVSDAYLGFVSIANSRQLEGVHALTLLVGGQLRRFTPLSYSFAPSAAGSIELLLLTSTFTRDELLGWVDSQDVEVRLESGADFKLTEKHISLLRELALRMTP